MPNDPALATWLAGGAVVSAFVTLWWIVKRWVHIQEDKFSDLQAKMRWMDDKKLDIDQFNGWTKRMDTQFERVLDQQERAFAESRDQRQQQGEKLDELMSNTQKFNLQMVERIARLERG
tara:strand:+ start:1082 stop:1438 length:357 start_codon:yes stop_codon:yes gene_type:complete